MSNSFAAFQLRQRFGYWDGGGGEGGDGGGGRSGGGGGDGDSG